MAKVKTEANNKSIEETLWQACDKLRGFRKKYRETVASINSSTVIGSFSGL